MFDTHPTRTMPHHSANALASADFAKTQTHSAKTALFHRFSPNWSALWRPNPVKSRLRRHQSGGIALQEGATRRRHADSQRLMLPNPHCHRCGERRRDVMGLAAVSVGGGRSTTGGAGGAEVRQYSPPRTAPGRCRYKIRPADPFSPRARDKIRPARPAPQHFREKTRPARLKTAFFARFGLAERTFSRSHPHQAVQGEIVRAQDAETWRR